MVKTFLDEQVKKGYICPSISPHASPFFFIKKKNGKLRPVQDYQKINSITAWKMVLVPKVLEHIHNLGGALIYTKIDVHSGYNNVWIKEGDEEKAVFKTCYRLFEPRVMFFGFTMTIDNIGIGTHTTLPWLTILMLYATSYTSSKHTTSSSL